MRGESLGTRLELGAFHLLTWHGMIHATVLFTSSGSEGFLRLNSLAKMFSSCICKSLCPLSSSLHHGMLPPSWIMACSLHHGVLPPSWCVLYNSVEAVGKFSIYGRHTHASYSLEVGYRHRIIHTNKACDLVPRLHLSLSIYIVCTVSRVHKNG